MTWPWGDEMVAMNTFLIRLCVLGGGGGDASCFDQGQDEAGTLLQLLPTV